MKRLSYIQFRFVRQCLKPLESYHFHHRSLLGVNCLKQLSTTPLLRCSLDLRESTLQQPKKDEELPNEDPDIIVTGKDIPKAFESIFDYEWPKVIKSYLERQKFNKPTPIQSQGWSIALEGRDMVGIAQTGSGKTLAYLLPALVHIDKKIEETRRYIGPKALILVPTRELAQQVNQICVEIGHHYPVVLYGGAARLVQVKSIETRSPELIIATPGRLNDMIDIRKIDLSDVTYMVIDEADRMLDLGFEPQLRRIIARTPKHPYKKQTLMWSATWPDEVRDLAIDFLDNFIQINVGSTLLRANPNITQHVIFTEPKEKEKNLVDLIEEIAGEDKKLDGEKILIFVESKSKADYITRYLNSHGWYSLGIHGDKTQNARSSILDSFRRGTRNIMVATDVASRGLDINDITTVINFDMPNNIEDYVHRIGRTARYGKKGTSFAFFTLEDMRLAQEMVKVLQRNDQYVDERLLDLARRSSTELSKRDKMGYRRYNVPSLGSNTNFYAKSNFRREFKKP